MRHFIVEITYRVPAESLGSIVDEHRAYLRTGYDSGLLLMSGPMSPRTGGILVARGESPEVIQMFCKHDPYAIHQVASHRIIEFQPVMSQEWMRPWLTAQEE